MDSTAWDDRYAAADLVWSAGPNATVAALVESRPPGRALDLAAGEGRNALWLAQRGWDVTAVDFSAVAIERTDQLADERLGADRDRLRTLVADVLRWEPPPAAYDLVLVVFLHLSAPDLTVVHRRAATALAPGGLLVVLAHDRSNLDGGYGGPQDRTVLPTPADVVADLADTGLVVQRSDVIERAVDVGAEVHHARDCLVVATRPDATSERRGDRPSGPAG